MRKGKITHYDLILGDFPGLPGWKSWKFPVFSLLTGNLTETGSHQTASTARQIKKGLSIAPFLLDMYGLASGWEPWFDKSSGQILRERIWAYEVCSKSEIHGCISSQTIWADFSPALSAIQSGLCGVSPQRPNNVTRIQPDTLYTGAYLRSIPNYFSHNYPWFQGLSRMAILLVKNGDPPALLGRQAKFDSTWNLIVTPKCEPPSTTRRRNYERSEQFKSHTLGV